MKQHTRDDSPHTDDCRDNFHTVSVTWYINHQCLGHICSEFSTNSETFISENVSSVNMNSL